MLSSVRVRNFKCIAESEMHFTYDQKKAPNGYAQMQRLPFIEEAGLRLVPCMAFYGANASGKSTALLAIAMLVNFALNRIHPLSLYQPYLLKTSAAESTDLEICWTDGAKTYTYGVEVAADRIVSEKLLLNGKKLFVSEEGNVDLLQIESADAVLKGLHVQCIDASSHKQLRPILPVIAKDFPGFDENINSAFSSIAHKFYYFDASTPPYHGVQSLAATFTEISDSAGKEKAALDLISSFLRKLDVRVQKIEIKKTRIPISSLPMPVQTVLLSQGKSLSVQENPDLTVDQIDFRTIHLNEEGKEVSFKLNDESLGTQKLFGLLAFLLAALRVGGTAIIDEFDDSLHSSLLPELLKIFQLRDYNTKKSQFLFTIHNTDLLAGDNLSVSEISFVSQNGFKGTQVRRLSSFENVRNINNFRKQYLIGFYDAIPSPFV